MSNEVAVRNGSAPAHQDAALALIPGQTMWTRDQHAALVAMGIPAKASSAELGVFLHTCQRLRLDPFLKQIYLIYRKTKENGVWVEKPTTQIGIDGFRVTRDRICAERGLSVEYEDTVWYDADGRAHEVWLWNYPPAACKFVVRVDGRRFPATLNFNEYCQWKQDGELNSMWQTKSSHQIEKCAEAEGLRKAFPNDLSGVILEDAAPLSDPGAPERMPSDRQRVTAADVRARKQTVTAEVIEPRPTGAGSVPASAPTGAPAGGQTAPPEDDGPEPAPDSEEYQGALRAAQAQAGRVIGKGDEHRDERLMWAGRIVPDAAPVGSFSDLTAGELKTVASVLGRCADVAALEKLLSGGEVPADGK